MEAARAKQLEDTTCNEFRSTGSENTPLTSSRRPLLREEVNDVLSGPVYREGDFVMVLKDTRPGINPSLSYDRDGRVTTVVD